MGVRLIDAGDPAAAEAARHGEAGRLRRSRAGRPVRDDGGRDPGDSPGPRACAPATRWSTPAPPSSRPRRRISIRPTRRRDRYRKRSRGTGGRPGDRLRPGPDRAGDRVRLLRGPGRGGAPPGGLARGDDQLEPGDGLDRLRRQLAALFRAARPRERAQRHRRRDARGPAAPAGGRRLRRPDAAQPRGPARGGRRAAAGIGSSRRSTRPRSGPASRRCSTGSASRSPRAGWPTASRRR